MFPLWYFIAVNTYICCAIIHMQCTEYIRIVDTELKIDIKHEPFGGKHLKKSACLRGYSDASIEY